MGGTPMRWFALVLLVGCAGAADVDDTETDEGDADTDDTATDTDTDVAEAPVVDLHGDWALSYHGLLPEQGANFSGWLLAQDPADYPELDACLDCADRFVDAQQAMTVADDGTMTHTITFSVGRCDPIDEIVECVVERPYGSMTFDHNEDERAFWVVNGSRTWEAFELEDYVRIYEGSVNMTWYAPE
jgi:hypothetical protein